MDTGTPSTDFENSAFWVKFTNMRDSIFMSAHFGFVCCFFFFSMESKAAQVILCSPFGELLFIGIWLSVHFTAESKDNYG